MKTKTTENSKTAAGKPRKRQKEVKWKFTETDETKENKDNTEK